MINRTGVDIQIFSIHGKEVCSWHLPAQQNTLDLTFLPDGLYILRAHHDGTIHAQKILILK